MGYWANTTYINHGSVGDVSAAVTALCAAEGMDAIAAPAPRERLLVEPMQYDVALNNDLWGIAVFPGAPSWTVIQTSPLELLGERAADAARMRLADLCSRLAVPAFQLNVYDSTGVVLVEVSKAGEVLASGINFASSEPFDWNGEKLSEDHAEAHFRLLPYQRLIADAMLGDEKAERIAERFGGANAQYCDNVVSVETLIAHQPFAAKGGTALYFKWPGPSRQRFAPAASWQEYQAATGTD